MAGQISAALDLLYFEDEDELRHLAVFLRWLATHAEADAANLLRLYGESPIHASVLVDDERTLPRWSATSPSTSSVGPTTSFRNQAASSEDALRLILVAGDER